ncbi:MAG: D-serine ammonia-lyase [Clostridia bacterium]|nr:D-serine ammonia-lyase [Clostridia bacterium]
MFIIVGLGNPGREYEKTRHNVGYMAADALAKKIGVTAFKKAFRSAVGEGRIGAEKAVIAKPETYMNNSGFAVVDLLNWYKPEHDRLIVILDDIDLPCGALRIRANGSAGTHNGMRSIVEQLGFEDFPRIRIGIGKPAHGLVDHVLGVPSEEDAKLIADAVQHAAEAAELIVRGKFDEAQTKFNYKPPKKQKAEKPSNQPPARAAMPALREGREQFWQNTDLPSAQQALSKLPWTLRDVEEAAARLSRFAPLIEKLFPETAGRHGIIESELIPAEKFASAVAAATGRREKLFIKLDSELPIAGSVKARGGIYEVLKHAETLALENGLITPDEDYSKLLSFRDFFQKYTIQVGSTGNLGLSIGISGTALGFRTVVHMSADAKKWKKDLLREKGAEVIEYDSDYSEAVKEGRELSLKDPNSYFIDDENSLDLLMGYAVAALRLKNQLAEKKIEVSADHPLCVYLPCGVGGAPGGITFGLKLIFGSDAHCYFVEPVKAPCMLAAFACGKCIHIEKLGLDGKTDADGLAVGAASRLVYRAMERLMDGEFTVDDEKLAPMVRLVYNTEGRFIEPSAAASAAAYIAHLREGAPENAVHILWATGGGLVPEAERSKYLY